MQNSRLIYINGKMLPEEEVKVSVKDRGLMYGDGVFETMRAYEGRIFRLEERIERLLNGLEVLRFNRIPSAQALIDAVHQFVLQNSLSDARIKLMVTRGSSESVTPEDKEPTVIVTGGPIFVSKPAQPWKAVTVSIRRDEASSLSKIKSLNYLPSVLGLLEAREKGADEGILLNYQGKVAEGTMSNLFAVISGKLVTPDTTSGALPGITRSIVIEAARESGITCEERAVDPEELLTADEIFATNSVIEIRPVVSVDRKQVGSGTPGPITQKMQEAYRRKL